MQTLVIGFVVGLVVALWVSIGVRLALRPVLRRPVAGRALPDERAVRAEAERGLRELQQFLVGR